MKTHDKSHHDHSHNAATKHACSHHSCESQTSKTESINPKSKDELLTTFKVANMDCADEIKALQDVLKNPEILRFQANLMASTIQIIHTNKITVGELKSKVESTVVKVIEKTSENEKSPNQNRIITVALAGLILLLGIVGDWLGFQESLLNTFFFVSILMAGSLVFPKAFGALKRKSLDMNVLMAVAAMGAVAIGEYVEATAVVFLFSLSELLESLSVQRARRAIQELLKITPEYAHLVNPDGSTSEIAVDKIEVSQIVRILPGESVPLDGSVIKGTTSINQSPLTGESVPVTKIKGEPVFAGTINQESSIEIEVTKKFSDSKLSQIIRLVEDAQGKRAVSQKFVDRFARIYTPAVMIISLLTFLLPPLLFGEPWHPWLYKALVLLVIACPCALVISTPVSIVSSLTALARKGVLIKGGAYLEIIGSIKVLAVDKTGTLTEGKPKVQKILSFNSYSERDILQIAASLESHSTHPLAKAIIDASNKQQIQLKEISEFTNVSGRGVQAIVDSHLYLLGNHKFAHETKICSPELEKVLNQIEEDAFSVVIVGHQPHDNCPGEVMGVIALGDEVRKEAKAAIEKIRSTGVTKIIMLSGDNQKTATAIGAIVGTDESLGDLLPEDKLTYIESLQKQYGSIAMIGDGINDAPAMAKSSLGIAMGAVGSDTAIETADIALMRDDLSMVAVAINAGRRTLGIIKFNITFSLLTKAVFILLTFAGYSNLWLAVAADTGAALLVILNSLRLLKLSDDQ